MKVELLYLDGRSSSERFLPRLRELVQLAGVGAELELRRIDSVDAAVGDGFSARLPCGWTASTSSQKRRSDRTSA